MATAASAKAMGDAAQAKQKTGETALGGLLRGLDQARRWVELGLEPFTWTV